MEGLVMLQDVSLVPVVTLETSEESLWGREQDWYSTLSDSGLTGLSPVARGSWNVPVSQLDNSHLETILRGIVENSGGVSCLNDPDSEPFLSGGFVLFSSNQGLVVEPTCCGDLRDISNWKEAASSSGSEWEQLWIGHPWLSYKYREPWLLLSNLHESEAPVERWAVRRNELVDAVFAAESELTSFAGRIDAILSNWAEVKDSKKVARMMSGLA